MTFSAFHYLTLSVHCEELDAHINWVFPPSVKSGSHDIADKLLKMTINIRIANWKNFFPHYILSQIYALFIEFYYALFLFFFFKDMHYNTMIRTFCILKKK
jgi:hypothetical protein